MAVDHWKPHGSAGFDKEATVLPGPNIITQQVTLHSMALIFLPWKLRERERRAVQHTCEGNFCAR